MTNFLDQLEADLRDAADRRGQPRRRRPTRALKVVAVLAALALLVIGVTRLADRGSSDPVAGEPTPTPQLFPLHGPTISAATAGDPSLLDLVAAPVGAAVRLVPSADCRPSTADPSVGRVVLYRPGAKDRAEFVAYVAKIDRVEPLTSDEEGRIDSNLRDADVVVVFGIDDEDRVLRDPDICAPAGAVTDGPLTFCVARSDEARFSRFVVKRRVLPVDAIVQPGWWSWAAAAPDGRTILAEWTSYSGVRAATKCHVPLSALISASGGQPQTLRTGPAVPLGWTTDGRAIVFRPAHSRCEGDADPGVYLVTADGEAMLLERTDREEPPPGLEPSIEPRTVEELTRAAAP
jgi:hypothetical protein